MSIRRWLVSGICVGSIGSATLLLADNCAYAAGMEKGPSYAATSLTNASAARGRSAAELRRAVATSMRLANTAKPNDLAPAVKSLADVYDQLGGNTSLAGKERLRLGLQVRSRLQRFASQLRYQQTHGAVSAKPVAENGAMGAAGPPANNGLNDMVELIQTTIGRPDDWLAQQIGPIPGAGNGQGAAGGIGASGGRGQQQGGGGAFGNGDALARQTTANAADLVDLIQKTIDPPSWDINGGPGSIMYFGNLQALIVNQTEENYEAIGGVFGGMRK